MRFESLPGVDYVQIDAVDGTYAKPACWPYTGSGPAEFSDWVARGKTLPCYGPLLFDIDLMVADPGKVAGDWIALGASRLTFHLESVTDLRPIIERVRADYGHDKGFTTELLSIGVAINTTTDVGRLAPYAGMIDYVQCMGIAHIGRQGEPFDPRVLEKIRQVRRRYPDLAIQIDGAATRSTAPRLLHAGADRLIVGHDLIGAADMVGRYTLLTNMAQEYGRYTRQ